MKVSGIIAGRARAGHGDRDVIKITLDMRSNYTQLPDEDRQQGQLSTALQHYSGALRLSRCFQDPVYGQELDDRHNQMPGQV